jgi:hypothetical protein
MAPRIIFEPKRERERREITGGFRDLSSGELHKFYRPPVVVKVM